MENKETLYQGGFLNTWLLDAVAIQANIINAGYINTLALDASIIQTGQLSADRIDVTDLVVKSLRTETSGQRIEILAANNNMVFYDAGGNEVFRLDDDIDSSQAGEALGGIRMRQPNGLVAYATGNGFFSNGGGMLISPPSSGITTNASIVGLLFDRNSDVNGISAAIVGRDGTTTADGNSKSYAGYFVGNVAITGALSTGSEIKSFRWSATGTGDEQILLTDYFLIVQNSKSNVYLPASAPAGMVVKIKNMRATSITVTRSGSDNIITLSNASISNTPLLQGQVLELIKIDGNRWLILSQV